jgi:hypothetical protein
LIDNSLGFGEEFAQGKAEGGEAMVVSRPQSGLSRHAIFLLRRFIDESRDGPSLTDATSGAKYRNTT